MKLFLDTNIFLRFLLNDAQKSYEEVVQLFEKIEEGKIKPYTSNIVILEIIFVLTKTLKVNQKVVLKDIEALLSMRGLTLIDKTHTKKALRVYKETCIKYADCLIATQIPSDMRLCTYDQEFSRIKSLKTCKPGDII